MGIITMVFNVPHRISVRKKANKKLRQTSSIGCQFMQDIFSFLQEWFMEIFWAKNSKSLDLSSEVCPARLGKVGLMEEMK